MAIDTRTPRSPGWWFQKLAADLTARQDRLNRLHRYFIGDADLPEGAEHCRPAYRSFQNKARTNFAALIVEAVRERMVPTGFRTGANDDQFGDKEAWRIWQANSLDADSSMLDRSYLAMGDAYVIVGDVDKDTGAPVITPEDPRQVITAHDPIIRRRSIAALKVFRDDVAATDYAYLYLPGQVWRAARSAPTTGLDASIVGDPLAQLGVNIEGWEWDNAQETKVPFVPVVRFANRPQLDGSTLGEFEDVLDILDRINFMVLQRLVITAVQAFRQRALKGDLPENDPEGNPIDYSGIFRADPGALWQLPDGVDMWESSPLDISSILQGARHDIQDLAAATKTPLFYLTPDAANGSAEGASLAREGLTFKAYDRIKQAGESWEQVMSYAFAMTGDVERAKRSDMEVIWAPPERFSLSERYDAASKAQAAGVPWETVMSDVLQFSPQQVERMASQRALDAFLASPQPTQAPATPQQAPAGV